MPRAPGRVALVNAAPDPRSRGWPSSPGPRDGSGSTPSSCPRAATGRCCASCRSPSPGRSSVLDPLERHARFRSPAAGRACSPTPRSRSCCTPAARTWRSCAGSGARRSPTSSTPRSRPASPASRRRPATPGCCTTCCASALAKSASFTRWDARPLTPEQVRYAREDVEHLLALADELQARLVARGRLEWAREECRAIAEATDERDPEEAWRRLPRVSGLGPRERAVARELAAWRERVAAAEDRPVGAVVRDPTVVGAGQAPAGPPRASWRRSAASALRWCAGAPTTSSPRSSAGSRGAADPARRGRAPVDRAAGRAGDRARRGARARAGPGGRPGLRADRRARRPRADRRRRPPRRSRSRTCARCAAGGASWSARSCSSCWPAGAR